MVKNVIDVSGRGMYKIAPMTNDKVTNSPTCFKTDVDAGDDIEPQVKILATLYQAIRQYI